MPAKALFLAVALVHVTGPGFAQEPAERSYRVSVHHTRGGLSPKTLLVSLEQWLGIVGADHDRDTRSLLFTTAEVVHLADLQHRLGPTGYHVRGVSGTRVADGVEDILEGIPPHPVLVDTGNELADNARYETAKAAWVAAFPDEYQRFISVRPKRDGTE